MVDLPNVLVVDDDPGIGETMRDILALEGYGVSVATSGMDAVELCSQQHFDFALMDIRMPGMNGVETLCAIKKLDSTIRVVMITGFDCGELAQQAMLEGAEAVFRKPLDVASFLPLLMI